MQMTQTTPDRPANPTQEVAMPTTNTHPVVCHCGCGEEVALSFGEFADTTITVEPCSAMKAAGVVDYTLPKSAASSFESVDRGPLVHRDGLVAFA